MSILDSLVSKGTVETTLTSVDEYAVTVEPHTDKAGRKSVGFKVYPVVNGHAARFGDLWIRVSDGQTSAENLRAFVRALPRIAKAAEALDARMVAAGEWKAAPEAKATPKPKAPEPKPAPAARTSVLDDIIADLPA